jgi:hypothetical protein
MSVLGKRARIVAGLVVALFLLLGTIVGDDDNFPFGPMRMYSTKQELDGEVRATEIHGFARGRWSRVPFETFGLRRADIEGQLGKHAEPPEEVLAAMYAAFNRLHDRPFPYEILQLRERTFDLRDGRPVGDTAVVLGAFRAP